MQNAGQHCYYAGMPAITLRNVPPQLHDEMRVRAALTRRSLQEYVMGLMEADAELPPVDEVLDRVEARLRRTRTRLPASEILAALDEDRE